MDTEDRIEKAIKDDVIAGILPSVTFRRLLASYPEATKSDLGSLFRSAFENVDGAVWNIVIHWQAAKNNKDYDTWLDLQLINELLKAGYEVNWSQAWVEEAWASIQNIVAPSGK